MKQIKHFVRKQNKTNDEFIAVTKQQQCKITFVLFIGILTKKKKNAEISFLGCT